MIRLRCERGGSNHRTGILLPRILTGTIFGSAGSLACASSTNSLANSQDNELLLAALAALVALSIFLAIRLRAERARRQQAERLADDANEARNRFLERLSTALRTSLNVILGFAQLQKARLTADSPTDTVRSTQATLEAGWKLLELLDDIVDISQLEQQSLRINTEDCCLEELTGRALSLVADEARSAGVTLVAEPTSLAVRADYQRLKQILVSLLRNAVQYNRPDGSVTISSELSGEYVICRVQDTGGGIADAELETIFEPFARLALAEQAHPEGAGIGLALAKRLSALMDGNLEAESTIGEGSTFSLRLPAATGTSTPVSEGAAQTITPPSRQLTVIYVEDHPASIDLMEAIMEPLESVRLLTSATAEVGIAMAREHKPDLILLDINLSGSGMDGIAAARAIRSEPGLADTLLVALSADASESNIRETLEAGFNEFVAKPLDIDRLWRLLKDAGSREAIDLASNFRQQRLASKDN